MLTPAQITTGALRLASGQLKVVDQDQLVSIFRMFFAELEAAYDYQWASKLAVLTDIGNDLQQCAQIAACLNKMEELGYGVAELSGNLNYKEKNEYWQYVIIAHTKLYPMPSEFGLYEIKRRTTTSRTSRTICSDRRGYC